LWNIIQRTTAEEDILNQPLYVQYQSSPKLCGCEVLAYVLGVNGLVLTSRENGLYISRPD